MAIEIESSAKLRWPSGVRLPVALTFELQSGEGAPRLPGDRPNYMVGGTMQYGARQGIWNILELLEGRGVKATFFICGATAEKYPDAVRAIHKGGHELAGMSYNFDRVRTMSPEREQAVVRQTARVLNDLCGVQIKGWRCPDYRISPQTLDVLSEENFTWDSSLLNDDVPYSFECSGGRLIELPFSTSTADKTFIGYPYPQRGGPDGLADVWNSEFDVLYQEANRDSRFMILSLQAWAIGRPAPLQTLKRFIDRLSSHNDIRFASCTEIASWYQDQTQ